jgi:predicted protein tyrosine phosphatase
MRQLLSLFTAARPVADALVDRLRRLGSGANTGADRRGSDCDLADQGFALIGRQQSTEMSEVLSSLACPGGTGTVCGLDELAFHSRGTSTHVLSILDPEQPEPTALGSYSPDKLLRLRFHDAIENSPGVKLPTIEDVAAILAFGSRFGAGAHPLVHCHFGISRSTAAMAVLIARDLSLTGDEVFGRLLRIRPRAWPNSLMVRHADDLMGRRYKLMPALGRLYFRQLRRIPDIAEFMRVHRPLETCMADAAANTDEAMP